MEPTATTEQFRYGTPFGARLIILADPEIEQSKGGIYIPETARERPQFGTVLAVGKEVSEDVVPGDRVVYGKHAGVPLIIQDIKYYVMQERELFMKLDKDELAGSVSDSFANLLKI